MEKEEQKKRVHEEVEEKEAKVGAKMEKDQEKIRVHEEMEKEDKESATMEREEQLGVQAEWEEEVEEAALLVRKSKPSKNTAINGSSNAHTADDVSGNGKVENNDSNGGVYESMISVTENGGADEESAVAEEEKTKVLVEPTTTTSLANGDTDKTREANENGQHGPENCVYYDKDEGSSFISSFPGEGTTDKDPAFEALSVTSQSISVEKSLIPANNYPYQKHFKDESFPTSNLSPSEFSHGDRNAGCQSSSTKEIESSLLS